MLRSFWRLNPSVFLDHCTNFSLKVSIDGLAKSQIFRFLVVGFFFIGAWSLNRGQPTKQICSHMDTVWKCTVYGYSLQQLKLMWHLGILLSSNLPILSVSFLPPFARLTSSSFPLGLTFGVSWRTLSLKRCISTHNTISWTILRDPDFLFLLRL